jgi:glycosyltransferase involved in cell wall biosynthesis
MNLTAVVLTRNEERHLPACLASLAWAPAVLVFDSFSTDRTVELARTAGAQVLQRVFDNYGRQRDAALAAVTNEWVLFIDADERVPPALAAEIQSKLDQPTPAWWVPRHNYIFGKLTLHAGWYPDYQLRLLRRALTHYDPARPVHELAVLDSPLEPGHLQNPLVHLNYETVPEFIAKQRDYARYDAGQLFAEGRRARPHNFILQPLRQFYWRYVTLHGWRAGFHGLRLSLLMAYFEFQKYRELARRPAAPPPPA